MKYSNYSGNITINAQGAVPDQKSGHFLEFKLDSGYNMFGNPFTSSVPFNDSNVSFRLGNDNDPVSLRQAIANGWIRPTIAYWNPGTSQYVIANANASHSMPAYRVYWIYNKRTGTDKLYMLIRK